MNISFRFVAPKALFSSRVQYINIRTLRNFSQSSTSLFDNLVIKKPTAVSKYGLYIFIINNNVSTTDCNIYTLFSLSCYEYPLASNGVFVDGDNTGVLTPSPNISIHYLRCPNMSMCIILFFISMFIPRKVCLFTLATYKYPKCSFISSVMFEITAVLFCEFFFIHITSDYALRDFNCFVFHISVIWVYLKTYTFKRGLEQVVPQQCRLDAAINCPEH